MICVCIFVMIQLQNERNKNHPSKITFLIEFVFCILWYSWYQINLGRTQWRPGNSEWQMKIRANLIGNNIFSCYIPLNKVLFTEFIACSIYTWIGILFPYICLRKTESHAEVEFNILPPININLVLVWLFSNITQNGTPII